MQNDREAVESTRAYYEGHAERYASATLGTPVADKVAAFVAGLSPGTLVLDLGSGSGRDLKTLQALGVRPVGLDLSPAMAAMAQAYSGAQVVVGDMRRLPFGSGLADGVWALASLLHLPRPEISAALRECRRILRRGGGIFSSVKRGRGEGFDAAGRWFTYFEAKEWEGQIRDAGFRITASDESAETRAGAGQVETVHWINVSAVAE